MLATQSRSKGVKYNVQLLLNGWVFAALLWALGSLIEFLLEELEVSIPHSYGLWVKASGWGLGGIFFLLFVVRIAIYGYNRKSGKYL
ncbi:hypothetical protein DZA28_28760 [Pseudomonas alloputida]|uniref:Uncharacterized protein n=3 Tax=Pseudomonas TaxID=286 RepID=A0A3G1DGN7_PSEAI|nr:hypothetical protein [Pseudomonas guariconensis]AMP35814.1 Hypothetical protein [Pseudomonas aeruginosa]AXQ51151.1 hypothetical protein DZC31_31240 [Stenotrophomonas rhizophila]ESW38605.1 hypothetical protein O164_17155 [Pseudomonas taiwanensis SJ9]KIC79805.1 hypothetical protein RR51_24790 [Pseudomonas sp. C5pp]TRZ57607.1 hypothetical protein DZA28_28760 [Pseudomonas alloputida]